MPKPILVFSFNPGGTQVLGDQIDRGEVLVDARYESDDLDNPTAYREFFNNFNIYGRAGFYDRFASVAVDGLSEMGRSMVWHVTAKEGRKHPSIVSGVALNRGNHGMRIQDWETILNHFILHTTQLHSINAHTMMTGHIDRTLDEALATFVKSLFLPGQSKNNVPNLTPEVYRLFTKKNIKEKKNDRFLLTENDGEWHCSTRMGGQGKIPQEAPANITELLKLVGYDYSDKELLKTS